MKTYSLNVRCTNCGNSFVRKFEEGSTISESADPCPVCKTRHNFEAVVDESMTATDGRQILHG
jgi:hypothetical protein